MKILNDIRVLDFGRYIAGPYCGALLGDLGAEVIRIERLDGSEDRFIHPLKEEGGEGAMFMQMNRNKKGMTLNPTKEGSSSIVEKLIKSADVVIANLPPQTLKRMGIDYETISKYNPGIILTTVSAFGAGGPYSERVGFDGVGQAMSGAAYLTGDETEPVKAYSPYIDYGTASLTAMGTLAAIIERNQTGKGQIVEGALFATSLAFMNTHLIEQSITKKKINEETLRLLELQKDSMVKFLMKIPKLYYTKSHFPLEISQRAFDHLWRVCESYEMWCKETKQENLIYLNIIE